MKIENNQIFALTLLFTLIFIIILAQASAEDYCFLKMSKGQVIDSYTGGQYTCDHTICQICYDQTNEKSASWIKCTSASICDNSESITMGTTESNDKKDSTTNDKKTIISNKNSSSTKTTSNNTKSNIFGTLSIGDKTSSNSFSPILVVATISTIFLFLILVFLLFLSKKLKTKKRKNYKFK